jgi:hypothetical protein
VKGQVKLPQPARHTFVVLVGNVHRGVLEALGYAKSLRPDHLVALHISDDRDSDERMHAVWRDFGFDIPLQIIDSPYRELVDPVERHLDELDRQWKSDRITVLIPEFVVGIKRLSNVLHGQSALALKLALLERPNTVVISATTAQSTPGSRARGQVCAHRSSRSTASAWRHASPTSMATTSASTTCPCARRRPSSAR